MKKILPIIVVLLLIGGGAYFIFGRNQGQSVGDKIAETTSDAFSGSLKMAVEKGLPMKCTYEVEGNEYEGIVKGRAWRGKMKSADGQVGEVIIKDNCMWSWSETESKVQGIKMCYDEISAETSLWSGVYEDNGISYRCLPTVVTDADFNPPAEVEFMDLSQFSQGQ